MKRKAVSVSKKNEIGSAGSPMGKMLKVFPDGRVETPGIDYETRDISVVASNNKAIAVKVGARSCWSGNYCPRRYASPLIMTFRVVKILDQQDHKLYHVDPLIEWESKRKAKS